MRGQGRKIVIVLAAIAYVAACLSVVLGDVATPRPQWTTVRLDSETVRITLGEKRVRVVATFQMYNEGKASPVRMGYPLGVFETALNDFTVSVDGKPVAAVRTQAGSPAARRPMMRGRRKPGGPAAEPYRFQGPYKQWKVWDVAMDAKGTTTVKVTYWVQPAKVADADKNALLHYTYTLRTGATWKGKISSADITVKLDDVAPGALVRVVPVGAKKSNGGKTFTWAMRNFKPTDDIEITYKPSGTVTTAMRTEK